MNMKPSTSTHLAVYTKDDVIFTRLGKLTAHTHISAPAFLRHPLKASKVLESMLSEPILLLSPSIRND